MLCCAQVSVTGPNYRPSPHDGSTFCGCAAASPTPSLEGAPRPGPSPEPALSAPAASPAAAAKATGGAAVALDKRRSGRPGSADLQGNAAGGASEGLQEAGCSRPGGAAALLSMLGSGSLGSVRPATSAPMQVVDPMASALYASTGTHPRWSAAARSSGAPSVRPSSAEGPDSGIDPPISPAAVSLVGSSQPAVLAVSGPASAALAVQAVLPDLGAARVRVKRPPDFEQRRLVQPEALPPSCIAASPVKAGVICDPRSNPSLDPSPLRKPERASGGARRVSFEAGAQLVARRSGSNGSSVSAAGNVRAWRRSSSSSGGRPGGRPFSSLELRAGGDAAAAAAAGTGPRYSLDSAITEASTCDAPPTPDAAHSNCGGGAEQRRRLCAAWGASAHDSMVRPGWLGVFQ